MYIDLFGVLLDGFGTEIDGSGLRWALMAPLTRELHVSFQKVTYGGNLERVREESTRMVKEKRSPCGNSCKLALLFVVSADDGEVKGMPDNLCGVPLFSPGQKVNPSRLGFPSRSAS